MRLPLSLWLVAAALAVAGCDELATTAPTGPVPNTAGTSAQSPQTPNTTTNGALTIYVATSDGDSACQRYDASGCKIDKLIWNLASGSLGSVTPVVETPGSFSPSLSPDGQLIAFDRSAGNKLVVTVRSLSDPSAPELALGTGDKSNWRNANELLFGVTSAENSKEDRWADLGHVALSTEGSLAMIGGIERYLGAVNPLTQLDSTVCSGEDPFTHPTNRNLVALHAAPYWASLERMAPHSCPWMTGLPNVDKKNPQPVVVDLSATSWVAGQTFWRFKMTWDTPFPGCAHLAFSPDGSRVLCTDQPTFHYEAHTAPSGTSYQIGFNRIYGFELATNDQGIAEYVSVRGADALFKHRHPAALPQSELIWDQSLRCDVYYTKRADFCGSKDRIVANVYCVDQSDLTTLRTAFSRVMLIDFSDPERPIYTDLTAALEDQRGVPRGSLSSFTAACQVP